MAISYDINGSLRLNLTLQHQKIEDVSLSNAVDDLAIGQQFAFTYGTGANQIDKLYRVTQALALGANATMNLHDSGTLLDVFGGAVAIDAIKLLYIKNNSANATLLLFGGNSVDIPICSNANDQIKIKPGGVFIWNDIAAAGLNITTNKNLRIAHDGTGSAAMDVNIIVGGI